MWYHIHCGDILYLLSKTKTITLFKLLIIESIKQLKEIYIN